MLLLFGRQFWRDKSGFEVTIDMSVSTDGMGQLFANTPAGYSERHASFFPLVNDGKRHRYQVKVPGVATPEKIRLDPGTSAGVVDINAIDFPVIGGDVLIAGARLRDALHPLKQLTIDPSSTDAVRLRSSGDDPFLELAVPTEVLQARKAKRVIGMAMMLVGVIAICILLWLSLGLYIALGRQALRRGGPLLGVLVALGALSLLGLLGAGCSSWTCSMRGAQYGGGLLLASLSLAALGAGFLELIGIRSCRYGGVRLFLWIAVGQTTLMLYVFIRSALHAVIPALPLTAAELWVIVVLVTATMGRNRVVLSRLTAGGRNSAWMVVELTLLMVLCVVIADRELPRAVMLSSDPDTHAYLARQVERLGGVPWRGEGVFHYPAGSAAMAWVWAKLSFLDVRNAVSALPLLQAFFAALILGEALAVRTRALADRLSIQLAMLGVTAAGFLLPVYTSYSHMEGAGRQMAIAIMAIFPALVMATPRHAVVRDSRYWIVLTVALFGLAALNPVNIVLPCILVIAYVIHVAIKQRRISWFVCSILLLPLLLFLEPYYYALLTGAEIGSKFTVSDGLHVKSLPDIVVGWHAQLGLRPATLMSQLAAMARRSPAPLFALLLLTLLIVWLAITRRFRIGWPSVVAWVLVVLAIVTADSLFAALSDDRRFYLLLPYFSLNLLQHKILLITAMVAAVLWAASNARVRPAGVVVLACLSILMIFGMRQEQPMHLQPRSDYCGSLGCVSDDDLVVMRKFETFARTQMDGLQPGAVRVLVPNSLHQTQLEYWIFPVAGARALPFFDSLPVAFYYYQGDDDYTTANYLAHVCRHFDRTWLKAENIQYVFLPTDRAPACVEGMETLPATEDVIFKSGDSYLLRLK